MCMKCNSLIKARARYLTCLTWTFYGLFFFKYCLQFWEVAFCFKCSLFFWQYCWLGQNIWAVVWWILDFFFKRSFFVLSIKPWVWPSNSFDIHVKSYLSWFILVFFLFVMTKMCYLASVWKWTDHTLPLVICSLFSESCFSLSGQQVYWGLVKTPDLTPQGQEEQLNCLMHPEWYWVFQEQRYKNKDQGYWVKPRRGQGGILFALLTLCSVRSQLPWSSSPCGKSEAERVCLTARWSEYFENCR